jgi:hypothetical protein
LKELTNETTLSHHEDLKIYINQQEQKLARSNQSSTIKNK